MKLRFLGTGTSTGIPIIGCICKVCLSKNPQDHRKRSSVLISINETNILIDAGPDIRAQLLENKISHIDAILITHSHYDHIIGLDELRPLSKKKALPLYAEKTCMETIKTQFHYLFDKKNISLKNKLTQFQPQIIEHFQSFKVGYILIKPIPILHGNMTITGYKIGNVAYITDVKNIPEESISLIKNIQTLVLGCLRITKHPTHFNLEEALETIKIIDPKKCYLTHIDHEILTTEWACLLPENVFTAYDGLEITISLFN